MRSLVTLVLFAFVLTGCHSTSLNDAINQECVDVNEGRHVETFDDADVEALRDRCWRSDNEGPTTTAGANKIFLEDGDLVMRVAAPVDASDVDDWTASDQAPMFFRHGEGDFLVVARTEAASLAAGDHCMAPGNRAGLVVRRAADSSVWATSTTQPFLTTQDGDPADCVDDENEANDATALVRVEGSSPGFPTDEAERVGEDGEADLAICRVGSEVHYFYGEATPDPLKNVWHPLGAGAVSAELGGGALDVGITAAGKSPNFQVAGHFNWIVFETGEHGDGCAGALEAFELPEDK